ncbi:hypothetical protein GCM10022403_030510 [Streptomyces coacervatus]|uniref:Lipoprotein n=1 Tax=Streptomyces coacervatus TaxID=647381 RepID=A0ABP7HKX9_9ACTN|nr:hypothetical protein [Streptomyces coacervatus]MDF2271455.1 hypothetical protein [Streptomyces coacervatus]
MNRQLRKATLVTAAITAGLLMTACQHGSTSHSKSHGSRHKSVYKTSGTSHGSRSSRTSAGKTSSGTIAGGTVTYLAPGKYLVSKTGRADQAFFVADDTRVYGAGRICGATGSKALTHCTLDQLETATKKAAVPADVVLRKGVAGTITEVR